VNKTDSQRQFGGAANEERRLAELGELFNPDGPRRNGSQGSASAAFERGRDEGVLVLLIHSRLCGL
jgi:hypothetical protein